MSKRLKISGGGRSQAEFTKLRTESDVQLSMPGLIIPSLHVNRRAGNIPRDASGAPQLKVSLNGL